MKKTARTLLVSLLILSNSLAPIANAETINLNATVPAQPTDFSAELQALTPGTGFPQDTVLSYEITYGSSLDYPSNITVQAEWSRGTISGDSTPTVDVLEYVIGSASNGYNNTEPVIDTVNRTITWTIFSFPGNTQGQTVTFDLKTTDSYTGSVEVDFSVSAKVTGPGTETPLNSVTQTYHYDSSLAPTPTPTALPTNTPTPPFQPTTTPAQQVTPTPTKHPTPTPSLTPEQNQFSSVDIRRLTHNEAMIYVRTTKRTTVSLFYGTTPTSLIQLKNDTILRTAHSLLLKELTPSTTYYFKIQATSPEGTITSDLFMFTTADKTGISQSLPDSVIISSDNTVLFSSSDSKQTASFILMLPTATSYTLRLGMTENDNISEIALITRSRSDGDNEQTVALSELSSGIYQGKLHTSNTPLIYELLARIRTTDGRLSDERLGAIRVVSPMTITNNTTEESIEGAKVHLLIWNERERRYVPVSSNIIPQATLTSTNRGIVPFVLPPGRYQAKISHIGFKEQTVTFTIGHTKDAGYPRIELEETDVTVLALFTYIKEITSDFINVLIKNYVANLADSIRFYHMLAASTLLTLSILTLLSFFSRSRLTPALLPSFLLYHLKKAHPESFSLKGTVIDHDTSHPLSGANIYALEEHTERIISHAASDQKGNFTLSHLPEGAYQLSILKTGYLPFNIHKHLTKTTTELHVGLAQKEPANTLAKRTWHTIEDFFSFSFELWLMLSFILLVLVGMSIGWEKIVGFLAIALFNLTIWSLHRKNTTHH